MARIRHDRIASILLNVLLAAVVLVNPLAAAAAPDCSALQNNVNDLEARVNRFEEQVLAANRALADVERDIASTLEAMDAIRQELPGLLAAAGPEIANGYLKDTGGDVAKALAVLVVLAFAGGGLGEVAAEALEALAKLVLVNDMAENYGEAMSAMDTLGELSAASPDFTASTGP